MTENQSPLTFQTIDGSAFSVETLPQTEQLQSEKRLYAYISSWTSGPNGAGADGGIHVFVVDMRDGSLQPLSSTAAELNAGYICISPDGLALYATDERKDFAGRAGAGGGIVSFSIDPLTGALTLQNTVASMGAFPAYIAIDATGRRVVSANHGSYDTILQVVQDDKGTHLENIYDDSTVVLFRVGAEGTLELANTLAVLERGHADGWEQDQGIAAVFRASAHAHSVNFDPGNRFVLACDKGRDRIYVYGVEGDGLQQVSVFVAPSGTSPRHSAFHPTRPYVFIIDELVPRLTSYAFDPVTGVLRAIQTVSTVSTAEATQNLPADVHVHPGGRFVYGSTRISNTIASFEIDETTGRLSPIEVVSCGGATPRGFNIEPSGRYLFAGNQDSDEVVTFAIDPQTGRLSPTGVKIHVPRPVCIRFAIL